MGSIWSRPFHPAPTFTETNLPSLKGKVILITGGASGIGRELASMLYKAGGKIYIGDRSKKNAKKAIRSIKSSAARSATTGQLEYLFLDLQDLTTIKPAVESFKNKEAQLDVLWNNAGVSLPPIGSVSKQGYELQLATNCLGPFLLTQLMLSCLQAAAEDRERERPRVIWTSSLMVDMAAPEGGLKLKNLDSPPQDKIKNYVTSKTRTWFLASELAQDSSASGMIHVAQNPGSHETNLLRHAGSFMTIGLPLKYDGKLGAYTEVWTGLSPDVTEKQKEVYVFQWWGRRNPALWKYLSEALKPKHEGGTGQAQEFRAWCEQQVAPYR